MFQGDLKVDESVVVGFQILDEGSVSKLGVIQGERLRVVSIIPIQLKGSPTHNQASQVSARLLSASVSEGEQADVILQRLQWRSVIGPVHVH